MIRQLMRRVVREQDGQTLVMALAAMSILAILTTGVIVSSTANEGTAYISTQGRTAFAMAQEALAYGEGQVYGDSAAAAGVPTDTRQYLPTQPGGLTGSWIVTSSDDVTYQITATGSTPGGVSRSVSVYVTPSQTVTTNQYAIWNYFYENSSNLNSISGSANINMPILARGDFGMAGANSKVLNNLEVGGNLVTSGNAQIGTSGSPISKLEVVGTCAVNGPAKPAGTSPCDGSHNLTYAKSVGNTLDTMPTMPTVDFAGTYAAQAAMSKSGCPANLFDSDTTMNNNNSANISSILFGSTDYDCKVGPSYELKWNHTTKTLLANGIFYFDGTLTFNSNGTNIVYSGMASFYFTGGVAWQTGTICGVSGCGLNWDTTKNVLFMVANCATTPSTGCVSISSANTVDQFGVYATTTYKLSGNAGNMGPCVVDQFFLAGGTDSFLPIKDFPPGTPAPTTSVSYAGTPPTGWSG
jgi:hypothetical protein